MLNFGKSKKSGQDRDLEREVYKYQQALERKNMALNLAENSMEIFKDQKDKLSKEKKQLEKEIKRLVQSLIPSEYVKKRTEDKSIDSWETRKLINFAIDTVKDRERELKDKIKEQQSEISDLKLELSRVKNQLENVRNMQSSEQNEPHEQAVENKEEQVINQNEEESAEQPAPEKPKSSENENKSKQDNKKSREDKIKGIQKKFKKKGFKNKKNQQTDKKQGKGKQNKKKQPNKQEQDKPSQQPPPKQSKSKNKNQNKTDSPSGSVNKQAVQDTLDKLDDNHFILIKTIGDTGIYRNKELKEKPRVMETLQTDYSLNARLNELIQADVLDEKACKVGARGHNYKTFALTDKGKTIYKQRYGKDPKQSFRKWLVDEHSNLKHGVLIHDSALIFKEHGYEVMMDRENNTVELNNDDNHSRIVFDLTIKKTGVLKRIECERGKGKQKEFNDKLDKFYQVNKAFYFVTPNKSSLESVKSKFFKWVGQNGGRKKVNVKMNLITLEQLKKGDDNWEVYDFTE